MRALELSFLPGQAWVLCALPLANPRLRLHDTATKGDAVADRQVRRAFGCQPRGIWGAGVSLKLHKLMGSLTPPPFGSSNTKHGT